MPGSNFDGEIKDAMSPNSKAMPKKNAGAGKPSPNPVGKTTSANATAKAPPAPHQFHPPQQQAQGQAGLQQASDQFNAHMAPGPSQPASSGLAQAHSQIINALAQRDMLKGH